MGKGSGGCDNRAALRVGGSTAKPVSCWLALTFKETDEIAKSSGVNATELHCTLGYLGKKPASEWDGVLDVAKQYAAQFANLPLRLKETTTWNNPDGNYTVGLLENKTLMSARENFAVALNEINCGPDMTWEYQPHMTLNKEGAPVSGVPSTLHPHELLVVIGKEKHRLPLR